MGRNAHAATITLGYWDYMYTTPHGAVTQGTLAGMFDRAMALHMIRERSDLSDDAVIELSHHTYQIPAVEVC